MTDPHVLYADLVPYDVPSSLDALHGPSTGVLTLPLHLWWTPSPTFDLTDRGDVLTAYRAVVREGRSSDQEALLNKAVLVEVWRDLRLPARCRSTWEQAFPELCG